MFDRQGEQTLKAAVSRYPIVTLTGPRQSGKTTLVRAAFSDYTYVSLELPDEREFAAKDPKGFLAQFDGPVILDEVQRVPDLFSYIQVLTDERHRPGQFILTGSHNFLLMQQISQSLAGRCAVLHLLPLSLSELEGRQPIAPHMLGHRLSIMKRVGRRPPRLAELLFTGLYPRIHDQRLPAREWLSNYYQTYLERDVRNALNVGDLETFRRFAQLCAGRNGQLLNYSALASECGVTHTTARRWLSILEASFLIALLRPHHRNFGKRIVKTPKLYFLDTGLLCMLLNIRTAEELHHHSARGALFEAFVFAELYKNFMHSGESPPLYFWRDVSGHEIDLLLDWGDQLVPIDVTSSQTLSGETFRALRFWRTLRRQPKAPAALVYGGEQAVQREDVMVYPWCDL
ncbi:MAG: ATP-binding protein [Candidatus Omnitrophica bacterium]|nr:ATP-binding protein [Candidatus Omnitrophota bacterium]